MHRHVAFSVLVTCTSGAKHVFTRGALPLAASSFALLTQRSKETRPHGVRHTPFAGHPRERDTWFEPGSMPRQVEWLHGAAPSSKLAQSAVKLRHPRGGRLVRRGGGETESTAHKSTERCRTRHCSCNGGRTMWQLTYHSCRRSGTERPTSWHDACSHTSNQSMEQEANTTTTRTGIERRWWADLRTPRPCVTCQQSLHKVIAQSSQVWCVWVDQACTPHVTRATKRHSGTVLFYPPTHRRCVHPKFGWGTGFVT